MTPVHTLQQSVAGSLYAFLKFICLLLWSIAFESHEHASNLSNQATDELKLLTGIDKTVNLTQIIYMGFYPFLNLQTVVMFFKAQHYTLFFIFISRPKIERLHLEILGHSFVFNLTSVKRQTPD